MTPKDDREDRAKPRALSDTRLVRGAGAPAREEALSATRPAGSPASSSPRARAAWFGLLILIAAALAVASWLRQSSAPPAGEAPAAGAAAASGLGPDLDAILRTARDPEAPPESRLRAYYELVASHRDSAPQSGTVLSGALAELRRDLLSPASGAGSSWGSMHAWLERPPEGVPESFVELVARDAARMFPGQLVEAIAREVPALSVTGGAFRWDRKLSLVDEERRPLLEEEARRRAESPAGNFWATLRQHLPGLLASWQVPLEARWGLISALAGTVGFDLLYEELGLVPPVGSRKALGDILTLGTVAPDPEFDRNARPQDVAGLLGLRGEVCWEHANRHDEDSYFYEDTDEYIIEAGIFLEALPDKHKTHDEWKNVILPLAAGGGTHRTVTVLARVTDVCPRDSFVLSLRPRSGGPVREIPLMRDPGVPVTSATFHLFTRVDGAFLAPGPHDALLRPKRLLLCGHAAPTLHWIAILVG